MIPKHEIQAIVQHTVEQQLGDTLRDDVKDQMVQSMYTQLIAAQDEQDAAEYDPLSVVEYSEELTSLGHMLHTVTYSTKESRTILELTHDVLMQSNLLIDLLFAHSQFLNHAQHFTSGIVEATSGEFQIELKYNGNTRDGLMSKSLETPRLYFSFYENEYVDITTWERFESWYHVEQNRPVVVAKS